jgi:hypothetical protein
MREGASHVDADFIAIDARSECPHRRHGGTCNRLTRFQVETRAVERANDVSGHDPAFVQGLAEMSASVLEGQHLTVGVNQHDVDPGDAADHTALADQSGFRCNPDAARRRLPAHLSSPMATTSGNLLTTLRLSE